MRDWGVDFANVAKRLVQLGHCASADVVWRGNRRAISCLSDNRGGRSQWDYSLKEACAVVKAIDKG